MVGPESEERRGQATDRRRYNRRTAPESSPPYYEVFERIAVALEAVATLLSEREVTLSEARRQPVRPRGSSES